MQKKLSKLQLSILQLIVEFITKYPYQSPQIKNVLLSIYGLQKGTGRKSDKLDTAQPGYKSAKAAVSRAIKRLRYRGLLTNRRDLRPTDTGLNECLSLVKGGKIESAHSPDYLSEIFKQRQKEYKKADKAIGRFLESLKAENG